MHPMASRLGHRGGMPTSRTAHRAARMETPSMTGRFRQLSRPHAQSRDCPKRAGPIQVVPWLTLRKAFSFQIQLKWWEGLF